MAESTQSKLDNLIDKTMELCHSNQQILLTPQFVAALGDTNEYDDKLYKLLRKFCEDSYLFESSNGRPIFRLSSMGINIVESGGYLQYLERERLEEIEAKEHQKRLDKATLDSANADVESAKSAKSSTKAAWFSAGLALIAIVIGCLQYVDGEKKDDEINELNSKFAKLDSLLKIRLSNVEQRLHLVDSSSIHKDSLKR